MSKLNSGTSAKRACGIFLLGAASAVALPAQTMVVPPPVRFTTLYSFAGTDGQYPSAVIQGASGKFYGSTAAGGFSGLGTAFKLTPSGTRITDQVFGGADGAVPRAGLVQGIDGNLYGTTQVDGANDGGTVFKITPNGKLTTLYSFCSQSNCTDGAEPYAGLVQGAEGDFYGTTSKGGTYGVGTVFRVTKGGKLTTLHGFELTDGGEPTVGLVQGVDGNLYGTTQSGGIDSDCHGACGTVFKITPGGVLTTIYEFCSESNCTDGSEPSALLQGTDGNFYGTTFFGGTNDMCFGESSCGTVFKISPSGVLTTLYNFCSLGNCTDGSSPAAKLVQGTDGNFYGTTFGGGTNTTCMTSLSESCGTVFKVTPGGTLTTLYDFCSQSKCTDGSNPEVALAQGTDGKFYGTTEFGGASFNSACGYGCGTVFRLSVGLRAFVETRPISGTVGTFVSILGTDLAGATSVTFNGIAAAFTVKSKSEITTTVPIGATTGLVKVVTPGGILSSNVAFQVLP